MNQTLNINVQICFPPEVDLIGLEGKTYNIVELSDYQDLLFEYAKVNKKGMYNPLKDPNFRWIFFSDVYEIYDKHEIPNLKLEEVYHEKWYSRKFMTVIFLDRDLKYGQYVVPCTHQEYSEDQVIYDKLYAVLRKNNNIIGKYIKTDKAKLK